MVEAVDGRRGVAGTRFATTGTRCAEGEGIEVGPGSIYEAVTRQMVEGLREELREIKGRLNGLLFMVAGAMLVEVALRLGEVGR